MTAALQTDVLIRAWDPNINHEGARFKAVLARKNITVRTAQCDPNDPLTVRREDREIPGLDVIAPSAAPNLSPADVTVRGIADQIKLTILQTPELLWQPINAHRDELQNWHIECVPFTEWLRLRLGDTDPETARSDDGR